MSDLPELPPRAFGKRDPSPDALFYAEPRLVTHTDERAISAVPELYRQTFRPGDTILDLMSSWISHLPENVDYAGRGYRHERGRTRGQPASDLTGRAGPRSASAD